MIGKLSLLAASALLALLLAEGLARVVYRPADSRIAGTLLRDPAYHRSDPELYVVPRANVRGVHEQPGSFASTFTTNSLGLRDREHGVDRRAGVTRIITLGDSFTWGFGVDDDAIYPALLEARLEATEVINLGVSGYGLPEEIAWFRRVGVRFRPDIVIVALAQNDIAAGQVARPATTAAEGSVEPQPSGFAAFKRRLAGDVRLYALATDAVNGNRPLVELLVKLGIKGELAGFESLDFNLMPALREPPAEVAAGWRAAFERLRELRALTDSLDARLVIALVPALQAVDPVQLERSLVRLRFRAGDFDVDAPARRIERFAAAEGIDVVNPLEEFRAAFRAGERLYLKRDMHFNERGHALFARALAEHFGRSGLHPAPGS